MSRAGAATVKARIKARESADDTLNKRAASAREHHENGVSERVRTGQNGPLKTSRTWSGQQDSNLRPGVPKTPALPGCAIPRSQEAAQEAARALDTRFGFRQQAEVAELI